MIPAIPQKRNIFGGSLEAYTHLLVVFAATLASCTWRPSGTCRKACLRWRRLSSLGGKDEGTAGVHMPSNRPAAFDLSETWTALTPFDMLCQGRSRKGKGKRLAASSIKQSPRPRAPPGTRLLSPTVAQVNIGTP